LKFEKNQLYDQREMKKIEICHEKLKWKFFENFIFEIWTEKSENFHFWTFFFKNGHITRGKRRIPFMPSR
jgi:hypothetical protein